MGQLVIPPSCKLSKISSLTGGAINSEKLCPGVFIEVVKARKPPDGFKQKRICETLSSKSQKNSENTEVFHIHREMGENKYVLTKHPPLSFATPSSSTIHSQ